MFALKDLFYPYISGLASFWVIKYTLQKTEEGIITEDSKMASLVSYDSCGESDNEDESLSKMAKYEVIYVRFEVTLMISCFQLYDVCYLCLF